MIKVTRVARSVLLSMFVLTMSNHSISHAEDMTKDNAIRIAQQAMENSGGNPDLQDFENVKDKGNYYEISVKNKTNAGIGTYKVLKTGQVEYKSGQFGDFCELNSGHTYAGYGIAKAASNQSETKKVNAVDSKRELNAYYVGDVKSSELPNKNHNLPDTGNDDNAFLTTGIGLIALASGMGLIYKSKKNEK